MHRSRLRSLWLLLPVLAGSLAGQVAPEANAPLLAALASFQQGEGHWAYRQQETQNDRKGQPKLSRVLQIDPSQPWDRRETLVELNGVSATARAQADYQKEREKERRRAERRGGAPVHLRDQLLLDQAVVRQSTADALVFEVPLDPHAQDALPPDKLEVLITVDPTTAQLRHADLRLRAAVRKIGVAKIKALEMSIGFSPAPEAARPAVISVLDAAASASLVFFPVGMSIHVERTDFRWVTPYDDRFEVQVGTATAIDF